MLAPETLHAAPSQRVGARNGRTGGASLGWGTGGVKDGQKRPSGLRAPPQCGQAPLFSCQTAVILNWYATARWGFSVHGGMTNRFRWGF